MLLSNSVALKLPAQLVMDFQDRVCFASKPLEITWPVYSATFYERGQATFSFHFMVFIAEFLATLGLTDIWVLSLWINKNIFDYRLLDWMFIISLFEMCSHLFTPVKEEFVEFKHTKV